MSTEHSRLPEARPQQKWTRLDRSNPFVIARLAEGALTGQLLGEVYRELTRAERRRRVRPPVTLELSWYPPCVAHRAKRYTIAALAQLDCPPDGVVITAREAEERARREAA